MEKVIKPLVGLIVLVLGWTAPAAWADQQPTNTSSAMAIQNAQVLSHLPPVHPDTTTSKPQIDHSGRAEQGRASYYARYFDHRPMADGRPMDPNANVAASKTLPLGTTAKVTNLENGKSATVKVEDRGPYIKGRVVDVTPKVADELGMRRQGVVPVVVKPITVPLPDGAVKLGAGAATATPQQIQAAAQATESVVAHTKPALHPAAVKQETASR
jgi:rare lipoprotein A